jgi:TIR domain
MPGPNATKLFISYAHADGAELAQHLLRDLAAAGLEPWLDTQRLYGGAIWTKEIEGAVRLPLRGARTWRRVLRWARCGSAYDRARS